MCDGEFWAGLGIGIVCIIGLLWICGINDRIDANALGRNICAEQGLAYDSFDAKYFGDYDEGNLLNLTINCKKSIAKEVLHQDGIVVVDITGGK